MARRRRASLVLANVAFWRRAVRRGVLVFVALGLAVVGLRELSTAPIQLVGASVRLVDTGDKVVALSFDDGPNPVETPLMLDLLDRLDVRATFFMMGRSVERWPDVARDVIARGHDAGNHSYSHPRLVFMRPSRVREEVERTDALLRGIGVTGDIHFSPPHGARLLVLPYVLGQLGKTAVYSYTDPEEWKRPPADVMIARVLGAVRPGAVVGFHDTAGEETRRAVEGVVTALREQGYRFAMVKELVDVERRRR